MIEIGTRVRIVGQYSGGTGLVGTVILATVAGDGYLVETDEQYTVMIGTFGRRDPAVPRRRAWCGPDELEVVSGPGWVRRRFPVRVGDFPRDLRAARVGERNGRDPVLAVATVGASQPQGDVATR